LKKVDRRVTSVARVILVPMNTLKTGLMVTAMAFARRNE